MGRARSLINLLKQEQRVRTMQYGQIVSRAIPCANVFVAKRFQGDERRDLNCASTGFARASRKGNFCNALRVARRVRERNYARRGSHWSAANLVQAQAVEYEQGERTSTETDDDDDEKRVEEEFNKYQYAKFERANGKHGELRQLSMNAAQKMTREKNMRALEEPLKKYIGTRSTINNNSYNGGAVGVNGIVKRGVGRPKSESFNMSVMAIGDDENGDLTAGQMNELNEDFGDEQLVPTGLREEVFVVSTVEDAKHALAILNANLGTDEEPRYHALDTEVSHIDVTCQTPVGHGTVICFSVFAGPDVNFAKPGEMKKSLLWVDLLKKDKETWNKEIFDVFTPYLTNEKAKKVWHNYSFDRHVVENHGIKLAGFAADTMHMARLWNTNRKLDGGYSLEALTSDPDVMADCGEMLSASETMMRAKLGMKKIFGKPKLKKDGTPGKTIELPPMEVIQTTSDSRDRWIEYAALDAMATWFLRESLEAKLRGISCDACPILSRKTQYKKSTTLWDFYTKYTRPFGDLLTQMESNGMLVDLQHLANAEKLAIADKKIAEEYFREWASSKCEDAKTMNIGSGIQIRQLLFAGAPNKRGDKAPGVEKTREFTQESQEWLEWDANGRVGKAPKKTTKITLHGIYDKPLQVMTYTATGLPAVSSVVLRQLAGKPGAAREVCDTWDTLPEKEKKNEKPSKICGTAYLAFGRGYEGVRACAAIDALNDLAAVDTLLSNFIIPLQGNDIRGPEGRVHGAVNINTETGRLSARRPSLQNQPALEKDRYGIRKAFTAGEGKTLIVCDYGQLELRLLAHMANCKSMKEAFIAGGDFHSRTALGMYPKIREAMDKGECLLEYGPKREGEEENMPQPPLLKDLFASERRKAKVLNFSIAYGKTAHGLAKDFGTNLDEANKTVELWYSDRPEVRSWQEVQREHASEHGHVRTLLGRTRSLPDALSKNEQFKSHALRAAINTPIQGGAADIAMLAMLKIQKCERLKELGYKLLMQIHDEVILEGPIEHEEEALALTKQHMQNPFEDANGEDVNLLDVELVVDGNSAKTWMDAK
jgi:DNA polymerase I